MWRWLWEGKHGIAKDHRPTLMKMVKSMVYSESEQMLKEEYLKLSTHPYSGVARVDQLPGHQVAFYKLSMKICRRDI